MIHCSAGGLGCHDHLRLPRRPDTTLHLPQCQPREATFGEAARSRELARGRATRCWVLRGRAVAKMPTMDLPALGDNEELLPSEGEAGAAGGGAGRGAELAGGAPTQAAAVVLEERHSTWAVLEDDCQGARLRCLRQCRRRQARAARQGQGRASNLARPRSELSGLVAGAGQELAPLRHEMQTALAPSSACQWPKVAGAFQGEGLCRDHLGTPKLGHGAEAARGQGHDHRRQANSPGPAKEVSRLEEGGPSDRFGLHGWRHKGWRQCSRRLVLGARHDRRRLEDSEVTLVDRIRQPPERGQRLHQVSNRVRDYFAAVLRVQAAVPSVVGVQVVFH
mmetsp:Transcript_38860/g.82659  ORF Transcript_38860/g.82659 Transcript_38860/m.82659 type:complete len:335 (+) Transcript_38860:58-1062(+)